MQFNHSAVQYIILIYITIRFIYKIETPTYPKSLVICVWEISILNFQFSKLKFKFKFSTAPLV